MEGTKQQYGVLLLNMGGPAGLDEVEDYIYRLLADPDMIRLPLAFLFQQPLARFIARRRAPKVRKRYALIGGKSPLGEATARQAQLLSAALKRPVAYAMRYTKPYADEGIAALTAYGAQRFIAVPLYPQYSTVSTLSSLKDLGSRNAGRLPYHVVDRHASDPGYIQAMRSQLLATLAGIAPAPRTHLLFVAHSIPEAYIAAGDPYAAEVEETVRLICDGLQPALPHSLAYQSRVGPVKWRGPTLSEELAVLRRQGVEQLVVQPVSFVAENLETLFDLDIEFREQCRQAGITHLHRVPTLSDSPEYIAALAAIVERQIAAWEQGDA